MGKKMKNAPVYFTVAQIRFNPILDMEAYLPTIQERMRKAHFPDFKRENIQQLILPFAPPADGGQPSNASFAPRARYVFGNINRTSEFILEHNAMALQTTAYDTSEIFFKTMLDGLAIVHEVIQLDFTERVGLRYFDAVLPKSGESLPQYLASEVLGLYNKLEGNLAHSYSETVTMNTVGQLISRVIIQKGRIGLPPEVMMLAPNINTKFTEADGLHATIDTDAFYEIREAFSLDRLKTKLNELHNEIEKSFKATVTPFALKAWE
jgi:uncharacterized protein (TIGR04255 family)